MEIRTIGLTLWPPAEVTMKLRMCSETLPAFQQLNLQHYDFTFVKRAVYTQKRKLRVMDRNSCFS